MRKTVILLLEAFAARPLDEFLAKLEPLSSQLRVPAKYWITGFSMAFTSAGLSAPEVEVLTDIT
jgi:hypothetical protein